MKSPFMAYLIAIVMAFSACHGAQSSLSPVVASNSRHEPIPTKNNATTTVVKTNKADTVVVNDTLKSGHEWVVMRRTIVDGSVVKSETVAKIPAPKKSGESTPNPKSNYKVAALLPFNSIFYDGKSISKKSTIGIEFYEGMKLAIKDLETEGVSMSLYVLDSGKDSTGIDSVFFRKEIQEADVVFGPVSSDDIHAMGAYAKDHSKLMISPLNPIDSLSNDNEYYVQLNPTIRTHCENIYNYIKTNRKSGHNIVLLCKKTSADMHLANYIQEMRKADGKKSYPELYVSDKFKFEDLRPLLSQSDTNTIIMTSLQSESFVASVVTTLVQQTTYDFSLFGMPKRTDFQKLVPEDLAKLNVYISKETFANNQDAKVARFKKRFFSEYGEPPSENVLKGYDSMLFFARMLKKYGTNFRYFYDESLSKDYISTKFKLQPVYRAGSNKEIDHFENKYTNILKFENFQFVPAD